MELSREVHQRIVQYLGNKSDLCSLTRVSKSFRNAAERALYNTILLRSPLTTIALCNTLASQDRLASLVVALTVFASDVVEGESSQHSGSTTSSGFLERYWQALAAALSRTSRLRYLNIHIDGDNANSWILRDCTFHLRSFHCDLSWDYHLVSFLNTQTTLHDLFLADYSTNLPAIREEEEIPPSETPPVPSIQSQSFASLSILECSYADAIASLVPGRPLTRIKTCFSREDNAGKSRELAQLVAALRLSTKRLRSLDLADSSYTEEFSLRVLREVVPSLPELRYVGTLVLPVGLERLQFFGLLRRLRKLHTVELEVSDWDPPPSPQAMRALASELRLYCNSVQCVAFVQEFERTIVHVVNGLCVVDLEASAERLWREV